MRFMVIFLAGLTLFLSATPCCLAKECDSNNISTHCDDQPKEDHDHTDSGCSPFFSCGSCTGFNLPVTDIAPLFHYIEPRVHITYIPHFKLSAFHPYLFKPPQYFDTFSS